MSTTFCTGVTLPQNFPVTGSNLLKDYDITSKTLVESGATNFMILTKTQSSLSDNSNEEDILDKISNLNDTQVQSIINGCGVVPMNTTEEAAAFKEMIAKFGDDIKITYCVYQALYRNSLNDLFSNLSTPISDEKKTRAVILNKKILIIIAGVNRVEKYLQEQSTKFTDSITSTNMGIDKNTASLSEQIKTLESKAADSELHKRMVEYTEEKNKAHRNLLSLYTVLNAVALGLIFYIAKE